MDLKAQKRFVRRGRYTVTAGVALVALGLLTFNASATFSASTAPTHAMDTGDMEFTLGSGDAHTIATASTDIVPATNETVWRTISFTVANEGGTMSDVTLAMDCSADCNATTQEFVDSATANGVKVWIERCSIAYPAATPPAAVPACLGVANDVLGTTGVPVVFERVATSIGSSLTLTNGGVNYLRVRFTWPAGAAGEHESMEAESATLRFSFAGVQRAGTNK